jgi:hypothetical protein
MRPVDLLTPSGCILIPKYQRKFIWDTERAHSLIRDVANVATAADGGEHWIGVVIFRLEHGANRCTIGQEDLNHTCREVIDGQQRLTTIRLWTKALIDHGIAIGTPVRYELTPFHSQSPNDEQFAAIEDGHDVSRKDDPISLIYTYFRYILWLGEDAFLSPDAIKMPDRRIRAATTEEWWSKWIEKNEASSKDLGIYRSSPPHLEALLKSAITGLSLLGVLLEHEEPERVFSALNGNRTELSQFDHLRNFCFEVIPRARRDDTFEKYWEPAEREFESLKTKGSVSHDKLRETFLYDYLISLGEGSQGKFNASRSFSTFQRFQRSARFNQFDTVEAWVTNRLQLEVLLWKAQREYFHLEGLAGQQELTLSRSARRSLHRIRLVSDGPPAPFVLWTLRRLSLPADNPMSFRPEEVETILRRLEGYLFKTRLHRYSLTNMRAGIIGAMGRIDAGCISDAESTAGEKALAVIDDWTNVRWSSLRHELDNAHRDEGFKGVYDRIGGKETLALLDAISETLSDGQDLGFLAQRWEYKPEAFSVEHIYPQKPTKDWRADLKAWGVSESEMNSRLHALGNLTALPGPANKKGDNNTLIKKQAIMLELPGVTASKVHVDWLTATQWTPEEIDARTHEMVNCLEARWPDPLPQAGEPIG